MTEATMEVALRGAPWRLLKRLANYKGDRKVFEILIEGAGGTGKSRGIGHVLFWMAHKWPGIRILVVRKTRASLTNSFLQTWEDEVVPAGHAMLTGPHRSHRERYDFGNGSVMELGGLDNPSRLYSTQYDVVYVQEAIELSLDEWEKFFRALRHFGGGIKFQILLGDTNPDAETHWLNERCNEGVCERMTSLIRDNPKYHDGKQYTFEGLAYVGGLQKLSGVRRTRLLDGKWCTAEGAVWDTWDASVHMLDRPKDLKRALGITWFVGAVDWGFSDPGVFQVWGIDAQKRAYRVAEWYTTSGLMEWWVEQIAQACKEFEPMRAVVCDPENKEARAALNIRLAKCGQRPVAVAADNARHGQSKGDIVGLDLVRERLQRDDGGKPHIFLVRDSSRCRDEWLEMNKQPTCTEREIPGYTYLVDETGKPSKERTDPACPDHGCFVAGTPVLMDDLSERAVESITPYDRVWTPNGAEAVEAVGYMGEKPTVLVRLEGRDIRCTPDHPFHVVGLGMIRADMLQTGLEVSGWASTAGAKHASSTDSCGAVTRTARTGGADTSPVMAGDYIALSSSAHTGQFLKVGTYITRTTTDRTTESRTSKRSLRRATAGSTGSIPKDSWSSAKSFESAESAVASVLSVARSSTTRSRLERASALTPASRRGALLPALITNSASASNAGRFSRSTATLAPGTAPLRVLGVDRGSLGERVAVFNLTVEPTHVYVAGGALTSNCDAMRYMANYVWRRDLAPGKEPLSAKPGTYAAALKIRNPEEVREWLAVETLRLAAVEREKAGGVK